MKQEDFALSIQIRDLALAKGAFGSEVGPPGIGDRG